MTLLFIQQKEKIEMSSTKLIPSRVARSKRNQSECHSLLKGAPNDTHSR